jgi:phosphatidylglycerophosphatase B
MAIKKLLFLVFLFYAILLCLVWFSPVAFTSCSRDSKWCFTAFWLTQSAGMIGTSVIVIITAVFFMIRYTGMERVKIFFKTILVLGILLAAFAFINEHLTKKILRLPRPSHAYLAETTGKPINLDSLYKVKEEERRVFFETFISSNSQYFGGIDPQVLEHWIEEDGYSFPSGHSFNAFLLACFLGFSMYHSGNKLARKLYLLPFFWAVSVAVSRVSIGAHTPLDVSFGAGLGIAVAFLFLSWNSGRNLIFHRKYGDIV